MDIAYRLPAALLAAAAGLLAQNPAPNSVQNPASNILPGLPNYGIAEGSIFVVYGSAMGPATIAVAPSIPLQTTLSGTSIQVTVGGTTVNAFIVYTLKTQVAAILPSNTPVGSGTLTVAYNGASGTTPIQVVQSNFGISTINQTGTGPGVVTFPNNSVVGATNSAKPGDTLVIWGTGLGPITGSDAAIPAGGDLGTPITVYLGGVKANVTYRGRSAAPGLDQINFVVPAGVTGCYVSLTVQTGNLVSNTTTTAIATGGGTCSDANGLPLSSLTDVINANNGLRLGVVTLFDETISTTLLGTTRTTTVAGGAADFEKYTISQLTGSASPVGQASIGSCSIFTSAGNNSSTTPPPTVDTIGLDAGPAITITPASGSAVTLAAVAGSKGAYSGTFTTAPAGALQVANGNGGADIGAFVAKVNIGPPLQWTNQAPVGATAIDRTKPLLLTWTGGDPSSYAFIEGFSTNATATSSITAGFICIAPIAPGQFTVPPAVLLSLPPASSQALLSQGTLLLGASTNPQPFTAPGLDAGFILSTNASGGSVTFQ